MHRIVTDSLNVEDYDDSVRKCLKYEHLQDMEKDRQFPRIHKMQQSVKDRMHRAQCERLYLIERKQESDTSAIFTVLGNTGNVYTVKISVLPSCDCPDYSSSCKHILFVYLRILKINTASYILYQRALLEPELQDIFEANPMPTANVMASSRVMDAYHGKQVSSNSTSSSSSSDTVGGDATASKGNDPDTYCEANP